MTLVSSHFCVLCKMSLVLHCCTLHWRHYSSHRKCEFLTGNGTISRYLNPSPTTTTNENLPFKSYLFFSQNWTKKFLSGFQVYDSVDSGGGSVGWSSFSLILSLMALLMSEKQKCNYHEFVKWKDLFCL